MPVSETISTCLVVTRHKLLPVQEEDVKHICQQIAVHPELPTDLQQLKNFVKPYDAIIGVLPLTLQIQLIQSGKKFITFAMTSLGVSETKEEAERKTTQYPGRTAILYPSKEGEKYRITLYEGLKLVKEIKVVDEWIIQHPS